MDATAAGDEVAVDESRELLLGRAADGFFAAAARGERPALTDYAQRYPQIAAEIRRVFPALALVADSMSGRAGGHLVVGGDAPQQLGDFRLIREIGRGGMGVVFEAEQLSIARRVALKILPFASLATDNALKRFQNEIRTAASLEHANIISIFASGEDRGVHFFAMQLIRGRSLADVIGLLRSEPKPGGPPLSSEAPRPASPEAAGAETSPIAELSTIRSGNKAAFFRRVAELGIQACEALDYAHSMGVVHRDVKPSNLMIDAAGRVWLTDFGLALGHADAGLTMTGDLVGTLRYMSPEQALGQGVVDHRIDVYSLGATLYELATLQPAFPESDRRQLLQAIAVANPPAPRQVDRDVPVDLDTIISKATEKDPRDRYASAKDLGDDLRRMLADEPTRARRASLGNRLVKWSRRHVAVVWAAAAMLLMTTLVLAVASAQVVKWYRLADLRRAEAEHQRQLARERLAESQKQRQTALAVSDFLLEMLTSASPERAKGPDYTVRQLLDDFSDGLTNRLADQPEVKATLHNTIGNAYRTLGVYDRSRIHLEAALDLSRSGVEFDVTQVADVLVDNALRLYEQKPRAPYEEIIEPLREALAVYRRAGSPPERSLSAYNVLLMALASQARIETGRFDTPVALAEEALAFAEASDALEVPVVASILQCLSQVQSDQRKFSLAEATARRSVALHRRLSGDRHPATGWSLCMLGHSLRGQHKYADAESAYREALAIFRRHFTPQHYAVHYAMENLASVTAESAAHALNDSQPKTAGQAAK